jgi:hypothetical protein|tara:strand:- start:406 stop:729 length:324 start_codon:yes stop_codon:yes gene_type:complete
MYISSLLIAGFLQLAAVDSANPKQEQWVMAIEVCMRLPPELEAVIKKRVITPPKRDCRWFAISESNPLGRNTLIVWPTENMCKKAVIPLSDSFFERKRNCQLLGVSF